MPGIGGMGRGSSKANPGGAAGVMHNPAQPWFASPASHMQPMQDRMGGSIPPMRGSFIMGDAHPWAGLPTYQEVYHPGSGYMPEMPMDVAPDRTRLKINRRNPAKGPGLPPQNPTMPGGGSGFMGGPVSGGGMGRPTLQNRR